MRVSLAEARVNPRRKALVLGEKATAQLIADQLTAEGFESIPVYDEFSQNPSAQNLSAIRTLLEQFSKESLGQGIVHPGTSRWGDRPELPVIGQELGLTVLTPPARVLSLLNNPLSFFTEAEKLNIPHLALSLDPMNTLREVMDFVRERQKKGHREGFPFILKSVFGGSQSGTLAIQNSRKLEKTLPLWLDQIRLNHGEASLFAQRYVEGMRRFSVPFVRFQGGEVQLFPIIDGSLAYQGQTFIEFCPGIRIDPEVKAQILHWTVELAAAIGFVGVGSFEFGVDGPRAFLLGGLPKLDVGFHLWEEVAGTKAVSWQIASLASRSKVSSSLPLPPSKPERSWIHGIALRIYAQDALFHLPQPGYIHELSFERGIGTQSTNIEFLSNYAAGEDVPVTSSGLVGVLVLTSPDRKQLVPAAEQALDQIWIAGSLQTQERCLAEILGHSWIREEMFHLSFIDEEFLPSLHPPQEFKILAKAICFSDQFISWVDGPYEWEHQGQKGVSGKVKLKDESTLRVCAFPIHDRWIVRIGDWVLSVPYSNPDSNDLLPKLRALGSGRVHAVYYRSGQKVPPHEPLMSTEAFGILVPHAVPQGVRIQEWKVKAGEWVTYGQELGRIDLQIANKKLR